MTENTKFYIGIDVSKPYFDVCLLPVIDHQKQAFGTHRFDNTPVGIKHVDKWLRKQGVSFDEKTLLVMENTGVYHRLIWAYCSKYNLPLHIGNAAHIKWSFGIARGKSDKIDAQRLCTYGCKHADDLIATSTLNPTVMRLKDLLTARTKLLTQRNAIKNYLKELKLSNEASVQKVLEKAHKAALDGLNKSIKEIEAQLQQILREHKDIKDNYDLLRSVPGLGHLTALYLIGCTWNFATKISGKQLASYAGVVPFENTSGISVRGRSRVHPMANKELKCLLHLCALASVRYYPEFKDYYERKKKEGKHSLSVLNAIKNKIALRAVAVINNKRPYVHNYA